LEDLEARILKYEMAGGFLTELRKKFGEERKNSQSSRVEEIRTR